MIDIETSTVFNVITMHGSSLDLRIRNITKDQPGGDGIGGTIRNMATGTLNMLTSPPLGVAELLTANTYKQAPREGLFSATAAAFHNIYHARWAREGFARTLNFIPKGLVAIPELAYGTLRDAAQLLGGGKKGTVVRAAA